MNVEDVLYIISSMDKQNNRGHFINMAYSLKGLVSLEEYESTELGLAINESGNFGPFEKEEDLITFSYSLSEDSRLKGVCICSGESLNSALLEANNTNQLNEVLLAKGEVLENPEGKKKGLFSNLF